MQSRSVRQALGAWTLSAGLIDCYCLIIYCDLITSHTIMFVCVCLGLCGYACVLHAAILAQGGNLEPHTFLFASA